jgi:hypothetical protein
MDEQKKLSPARALQKFFAPITVTEIKEFKDADLQGYDEIARLCVEYYANGNK